MTESIQRPEMNFREATGNDIPQLAIHHRRMFEEIWGKRGQMIEASKSERMEEVYRLKLEQQFADGTCKAWVIENNNSLMASGAITIVSFVPTPDDFSHQVGYLHSMYTEKAFRRNRFANRIVERIIEYCKTKGIKRVILIASEAGKPIYERIGFRSAPETMKLFIG
jgi:GNAT superfamily N-acetyltransferase